MILSPQTVWNQNGITVAGYTNGTNGSSLSQLYYPIGISITDDDVLYIADSTNHRIIVVHLDSSIETFAIGSKSGSMLGLFSGPHDVFIFNSSLYIADTGNNRIQKMSLNSSNSTSVLHLSGLRPPTYFYIDNFGRIYVSDFDSHSIFVFYSNSTNVTRVAGNGINGSTDEQLNGPYGIFVNNVGTIYIADCYNHRIMKWLPGVSHGIRVAGDGTPGNQSTQLNAPTDIIVDENEYMYISESGNARVTRWDPNSTCGVCIVACTGIAGITSTQMSSPHSLAFDSFGSLYVSEWGNHRVQKYELLNYPIPYNQPKIPSNQTWSECGITFADNSSFNSTARGIFIDLNDTIYLSDYVNNQILIWSIENTCTQRKLTVKLYEYTSIFVTLNGDIYFENGNELGRIEKFSSNSTQSELITNFFGHCRGLFVDSRDSLYCSLSFDHRVGKISLTSDNHTIITIAGNGTLGSQSTQLNLPWGIFVDIYFNLYVADSENNRIQLFRRGELNGITVAGNNIPIGLTLKLPTDVIIDGNDYFYIADNQNHRIIQIRNNEFHCLIGCKNRPGSTSNQLNIAYAVRFDSYGNLYIADEWNYRIQKFSISINSCQYNSTSLFFIANSCGTSTNIGLHCNISGNICDIQNPCLNNGTCNHINNNQDYNCSCPNNFSGKQCQFDKRICKENTCLNNGICNVISNLKYNCKCLFGYEGTRCERRINYCLNVTCYNKGVCYSLLNKYLCQCLSETYGEHCEKITRKLFIYKIISKSVGYIGIIAIISVILFVILMDFLKYCFGIDPTSRERQRQRKKCKRIIQRFVYVNAIPIKKRKLSKIIEEISI